MSARLDALNLDLVAASRVEGAGAEWALAREKAETRLVVAAPSGASRILDDFEGETSGVSARLRPRRTPVAEERGRAAAPPRVAPPAPARHAHLGRPGRPPRPRDTRPRARRARGGRRRRDRPDLPAAVDPRDDPHRPHARRGHGRRDLGDVRRGLVRRHGRRRRPPEDDGRHRRLPRGGLLDVHDRPGRARRLRRGHRPTRPRSGPARRACPGRTSRTPRTPCGAATSASRPWSST